MIPQRELTYSDELEVVNMPSLTYTIDYKNNRIGGTIDSIKAVEQAVDKILNTPRYSHKIYPDWYGHELCSLIGQDRFYVESEVERMIRDALLTDDRIIEIKDFTMLDIDQKDALTVKFTVITTLGEVGVQKEVTI
ncbi:DUF2634 domain-containing protein [Alkaliphilus sp. B6464]|uniref:DUF2634 domain-containing protein n=1 Tax=Alkaliphilus sp. B6464 TaxID=2731219 RepID=UPI001BABF9C5|nr:DUF2634 domain-containing protein [Alkaliphilus sp. B6464]QUH21413.1 DUF2634 domain-containing protein [Alkaliphilus sp. B6464]